MEVQGHGAYDLDQLVAGLDPGRSRRRPAAQCLERGPGALSEEGDELMTMFGLNANESQSLATAPAGWDIDRDR